ncbi:MAG: hypothetical protein ACFFBD_18775, partial [Candidatus Hodarchaeota archaeon]
MVYNFFSILSAFIRNNWKLLLASTIGLTLALTTVSQTTIIVQSYREGLFADFINTAYYGGSRSDFDIELRKSIPPNPSNGIEEEIQDLIDDSLGLGQRVAEILGYENFVQRETWHYYTDTTLFFNSALASDYFSDIGVIDGVNNETLAACQSFLSPGSTLPQGTNETILIIEQGSFNQIDLDIGDKLQFGVESSLEESQGQNATAIITGLILFDNMARSSQSNEDRNTFWDYFDWNYGRPILLTTLNNLIDFSTTIYENQTFSFATSGQINIDLNQLDALNLAAETQRLDRFQNQLELECTTLGYYNFYVQGSILYKIVEFELQFTATVVIMWLFSLPTLVATLFLANFSLSLLQGKKHLQVGILKTRGAAVRQILVILLSESFITTFLSVAFGAILGLPFSIVILKTEGFLRFTGEAISPSVSLTIMEPVFTFGLIFAFLLNLRSILRMSKMGVNESIIPLDTRRPLWKKFYVDVIIFLMGLVGIFALLLLQNLLITGVDPTDPSITIIFMFIPFIALFFGLPSPILVTVGGAMLAARLLPVFLRIFARWTWKVEGGIIAFSFRNVLQRVVHASRATLLISIVLAFSLAFISIPYNNDANTFSYNSYHYVGADILVSPVNATVLNQSLISDLQTNFPGVALVSPVVYVSGITPGGHDINVLGVNISTYHQTVYFRDDYLNPDALASFLRLDISTAIRGLLQQNLFGTPDLPTLLSKLQSNKTVLVQEDSLRARSINPKEPLPLILRGSYNSSAHTYDNIRYDFDVVGTFKFWPLFIRSSVSSFSQDVFMVTNLQNVFEYVEYENSTVFTITDVQYLVRVNPGVSSTQLKEQIANVTQTDVICAEELIEDYLDSPPRKVLLTTINGSVLMLMIVAL